MGKNSKIEWTHHTFNPWWGWSDVGHHLTKSENGWATRLRIWGEGVRIPSGAPFAYKTTNISVRGLFSGNDCLQHIPAANNRRIHLWDLPGSVQMAPFDAELHA